MKPKIKETYNTFKFRHGIDTTNTKLIVVDSPGMSVKTFKFKYRNYNAGEEFTGELFDGSKLNPIFTMKDLGLTADRSAYLLSTEDEIKRRISTFTTLGINFITELCK